MYMKLSGSICLCIFQISDLYLVFLVSHMILKLGSGHESVQCTTISSYFLIFTAPELKIYVSYVYETIRDYRGSICLCIFQISDLYLVFLVSHMILKLGSGHESVQCTTIPSYFLIFTAP